MAGVRYQIPHLEVTTESYSKEFMAKNDSLSIEVFELSQINSRV